MLFAFSALTLGRQEEHPACKKTEWWGVDVVMCPERGADCLHMVHWCHCIPKPRHLLPHLDPDWFYLSGTGCLTGVVVVVAFVCSISLPSVLWCCWLGGRKGTEPAKHWVVGCWRGYLSGARCRLAYGSAAQLMPLPLTVSCVSKIQTGFTFLLPANLGSPGQRAVKRWCVCMLYVVYIQLLHCFGRTATGVDTAVRRKTKPRTLGNVRAAFMWSETVSCLVWSDSGA